MCTFTGLPGDSRAHKNSTSATRENQEACESPVGTFDLAPADKHLGLILGQ